jgi:nucleotide-binding universal stress UspA family protein
MYERILVPLDGSDFSESSLPHAKAIGERFHATITLMLVTTTPRLFLTTGAAPGGEPVALPVLNPKPLIEGERRAARDYLEIVAQRLRDHGIDVDTWQPDGSPAELILEHARSLPAGLIVMATHGHGGLGRLVHGSVAEAVLHSAPCPVLLVRVAQAGH